MTSERTTLAELRACFASWQPDVCVLGNVRAADAVNALDSVLQPARVPEGWWVAESAAGKLKLWPLSDEARALLAHPAPEADAKGGAVAWLVDWPDEPELGHTLSEWPVPHARNRALGVIAHPAPEPAEAGLRDAYEGAREDLLDWKGRAQRAEAELRRLGYAGVDASEKPAAVKQGEGREGVEDEVAIAAHWLQNIESAAAILQNSYSIMDRREGDALRKLVKSARRLSIAPQPDHSPGAGKMADSAKAVIKRWESPLWKQEVCTAELINNLRKDVDAYLSQRTGSRGEVDDA